MAVHVCPPTDTTPAFKAPKLVPVTVIAVPPGRGRGRGREGSIRWVDKSIKSENDGKSIEGERDKQTDRQKESVGQASSEGKREANR